MMVSSGPAQYKPHEDMRSFVHRVDQWMYQGKRNGKDRVPSGSTTQKQFQAQSAFLFPASNDKIPLTKNPFHTMVNRRS
jgi:hypothetical protein